MIFEQTYVLTRIVLTIYVILEGGFYKISWIWDSSEVFLQLSIYCRLKAEALERTPWRTRFGIGYGPLVRQTMELIIFMVTLCISSNKYFIIQRIHSIIWIVGLLKTHWEYKICSDMFWFTQEPSSGSQSQCLAKIACRYMRCQYYGGIFRHVVVLCVCVVRHARRYSVPSCTVNYTHSVPSCMVNYTHTRTTGRNMPP